VAGELARVAGAASALPGDHEVRRRVLFVRPPYRTPEEAAVVARLREASPGSREVGLSFWADSALFGHAGVPSVLYGPVGHGAHAVDEWVSLKSLVRIYAALRALLESRG
jgi:acetylornithine deacetylase/succinyl-diaminopimelate desuccinylase-like protein